MTAGVATLVSLPDWCSKFLAGRRPVSEQEMREYEWTHEVVPHLKAARLPERYWYELETWNAKQKQAYNTCRSLLTGNGAVISLIGPRGTGKTTIAAQLIVERAKDETLRPWERRPPYRKLSDLAAKLKPLYSDFGSVRSEELVEYRDRFCRIHPLVVIDEIHECHDLHAAQRLLTDLVDRRYANRQDTILISNQTFDEFRRATNPSTLSRLEEHGAIIVCDWKSFRTSAGEARQNTGRAA